MCCGNFLSSGFPFLKLPPRLHQHHTAHQSEGRVLLICGTYNMNVSHEATLNKPKLCFTKQCSQVKQQYLTQICTSMKISFFLFHADSTLQIHFLVCFKTLSSLNSFSFVYAPCTLPRVVGGASLYDTLKVYNIYMPLIRGHLTFREVAKPSLFSEAVICPRTLGQIGYDNLKTYFHFKTFLSLSNFLNIFHKKQQFIYAPKKSTFIQNKNTFSRKF